MHLDRPTGGVSQTQQLGEMRWDIWWLRQCPPVTGRLQIDGQPGGSGSLRYAERRVQITVCIPRCCLKYGSYGLQGADGLSTGWRSFRKSLFQSTTPEQVAAGLR